KYTNLSMLADVDFGVLKLDKSLVGALGSRTNYQAILKNLIRMCQDLVIEVVAEGVETHEQEAILRDLECKLGQGYLYGKPMPASEFERAYL
ncbi:MAG: EAL domain-containing protein, partial [Gordonibacter sp.]|uniref:EAL domain-containing protein n=3 Tax=Gordonibacter sp. TaxID=1968902 RepID=UPI002FC5A5C6